MKDYSQHGEGRLIFEIVAEIERNGFVVPKVAVEFGAGDGFHLSNIRGLMEEGWAGLQYDKNQSINFNVQRLNINRHNVNTVIEDRCENEVGVLSIDIDGNDYWVWKALYARPAIVVIEFNPTLEGPLTIPYDPEHVWAGDNYF
jgi:hypothetical protein